MLLQGKVFGVFRDKDTGEITKTVEGENHFQDTYLTNKLCITNSSGLGTRLFVSETNPGKQRYDWPEDIPSCVGSNTILSRDVLLDETPSSHLLQLLQRFDAPAQALNINMAGICVSVSAGVANDVASVVWFSSPCVQATNETLDLYYRVYTLFDVNWRTAAATSVGLNRHEMEIMVKFFDSSGSNDFLIENDLYLPRVLSSSKFNPRPLDVTNYPIAFCQLTTQIINAQTILTPTYFRKGRKISLNIADSQGMLIGMLGTDTNGALMTKVAPLGQSPLQSLFGHRSTATVPFYEAASAQLSLGQLGVNADAWTDPDFPKMVQIDMQADGLVGASTYNFRIRNHFGFEGNTFKNRKSIIPFTEYHNAHYSGGMKICKDNYAPSAPTAEDAKSVATPIKYNGTEVLFLWNNEICFLDILTGIGETFDNTTIVGADLSPRFQATDIGQVLVDGSLNTYVSCRNTGLYKFNAARNTLTIINSSTPGLTNTTGCVGICEGNAGRLWGYFNHSTQPSLYYSDDGGANWVATTMSDVFLDANPNNVIAIKADPNDAAGKLMIHYYSEALFVDGRTAVKWWDQGLTTLSDGPADVIYHEVVGHLIAIHYVPNQHHQLQCLIECSPNNSVWACVNQRTSTFTASHPAFLTFGSAVMSQPEIVADEIGCDSLHTHFIQDSLGNDALYYVTTNGQTNNVGSQGSHVVILSTDLTFENADVTAADNAVADGGDFTLYFGDGVWLGLETISNTNQAVTNYNHFYLFSAVPTDPNAVCPTIWKEVFPTYGWNVAAWERDHAGLKATHAAAEELIQGVTILFDDNVGTNTFLSSDHYNFGLFDGVWADGSTTFDFTWEVYVKPTTQNTDVESSTLPAGTKVSNVISLFQTADELDYVDRESTDTNNILGEIQATGTGLQGDYTAGGRSAAPAILGDVQTYLPNNVPVPNSDNEITNAQGWVEFRIDMDLGQHLEAYMGLSSSAVITTPLNHANIQYALHFDSVTPGNGPGTCTVRVVESGIQRAVVTDIPYDDATVPAKYRIILLVDGSMVYEYYLESTKLWTELYRTPAGTVTVQNYHLDFHYVPRINYGFKDVKYFYLDTSKADHYLYLGNGVDSGLFANEFYAIDPDYVTVTIDGAEAVPIGINDTGTVLAANTYSVFPEQGVIRYSNSDVGKAVTASYITITHS